MNHFFKYFTLILFVVSCRQNPQPWNGETLTRTRNHVTTEELRRGSHQPLLDMSYFAKPDWGSPPTMAFSGTVFFKDTPMAYPKEKEYYAGENIFPAVQLDFVSNGDALIPREKRRIITRHQSESYWDVIIGEGKVWHEESDGGWNRASFPLTLTDRWVGQARNCVATFAYTAQQVSHVCLQCSQETADIDDRQLGNISGMLPATFQAKSFDDSVQMISHHIESPSAKLPVRPLSEIDAHHNVAGYFDKMKYTNAPTSMGAIWMDSVLYVHPSKTRHGLYPYPEDMRHGLYSVTKSMAGALALMFLAARYPEADVFNTPILNYVPDLAHHEGWKGVTFSHTLNMVTGTIGGEGPEHLYSTLVVARTAEEAIMNIARLGDAPEMPGEKFNYASTNLFVLSYAMQKFVEQQEGRFVNYWDLVEEHVLKPIGAEHFAILKTMEDDESRAIPWLAYGALPTIDEAAKIALLFANGGNCNGQQLLDEEKIQEIFAETKWAGYGTGGDFRGANYRHSFWSKEINLGNRKIIATYMLGFGESFVVFLPGDVILFRFMDEHDLVIDELITDVMEIVDAKRGEEEGIR